MQISANDIEREYAYRPGWLMILACGGLFTACTAVLGYVALTNDRGMTFRHLFTLAPGEAAVVLWVLAGLSAGFVLISIALVWHRIAFRQRLALTAGGIILPQGRWSQSERFIAYDDIHIMEAISVHSQRFLHIHHAGGKHTITASMLPARGDFDAVCAAIGAKRERRATSRAPATGDR